MQPSPIWNDVLPGPGGLVIPLELIPGPGDMSCLEPALALAREWAGEGLVALVLSGSHASGEAIWGTCDGRALSLSDLDLYAVMRDAASAQAAESRARSARPQLALRLLALGLAAPLEVGFLTLSQLSRLPARPGTLALARRGRVVCGDAGVLEALPRWTPADVPAEETRLLLENRGFEILASAPSLVSGSLLSRLQARHALLKAAADLASVLALSRGEFAASAEERIAWVRANVLPQLSGVLSVEWSDAALMLDQVWAAALEWRHGAVAPLDEGAARAEWRAVTRAWCAVWWLIGSEARRDPWERALAVGARAPLRRRLRQAVFHETRSGQPAPLALRVRHALAGTPQHRANASAAVLLLAASSSPASSAAVPALPVGALRTLRALGVTPAREWERARAEVVRAWDLWVLEGQRTAEGA